eukprot:7341996-Prorocentrum_lima.AAC.1
MRDGQATQALVVDGLGLYNALSHPLGDSFHFQHTSKNTDILDNYLVDAVQLLQMLFWGGSPLIPASIPADLRNARVISKNRVEK